MRSVVGVFERGARVCTRAVPVAALAAVSAVGLFGGVAHADYAVTRPFSSDSTWSVYTADPATQPATRLGSAQTVCLNASSPSPCPTGAVEYGSVGYSWASIPGAKWVWLPNVRGWTKTDSLKHYFSKTFSLGGEPAAGAIDILVDDYAEVFVNGAFVDRAGSLTDQTHGAYSHVKHMDLTPFLGSNPNVTVTVAAQNGPDSFASCTSTPCVYGENPAGVAFRGTLTYTVATSTP